MNIATSIRRARTSDQAQLEELLDELDRFHTDGAPWLLRKPERSRPLEWLQTLLASQHSAVFVADFGACVGLPPFTFVIHRALRSLSASSTP